MSIESEQPSPRKLSDSDKASRGIHALWADSEKQQQIIVQNPLGSISHFFAYLSMAINGTMPRRKVELETQTVEDLEDDD